LGRPPIPQDSVSSFSDGVLVAELPYGVAVRVAYDGTNFSGWQRQPGQRTVQDCLHAAALSMAGKCSKMRGCSRTDAGVHALGQEVSFASARKIEPQGWRRGLNKALPDDISIQDASECDAEYDPRGDVTSKLYRYLLRVGPSRNPLTRFRAWHIGPRLALPYTGTPRTADMQTWLDTDAMQRAADHWVGEHDFQAMRSASDDRENTIRRMDSISIRSGFGDEPSCVAIDVRGNAFMKNMVRILAGTLLDIGRHHLPVSRAKEMLAPGAQRSQGGPTAPAHGLTLVSIDLGRYKTT